ncbi:unnamed protein product [Ilex paraguariensis]|uniref:Sulfotransferase n=1 Tax=Ilex paraguariensis TaxID=185542 RepID=A0ABC8SPU0_9AQUA
MPTSERPLPPPKYLEEDDLTQECRDLLPLLPRERGWVHRHLYQYQGFWHTSRQLQGVLACQRHFEAQDTDILLVTTPKSGTTWLKAIMFSLMNRTCYPDTQQHPLLNDSPHNLVPFLEINLYAEKDVPDLTSFAPPRLFSTHLPFVSLPKSVQDSACKLVYLCRDPRDIFVSFWHFTNKLRPLNQGNNHLEEMFDLFCTGVSLSGPFWDHAVGYWKESLKNPRRVFFLKYEEMKEQPAYHLKRIAQFLGCPLSTEEEAEGVVNEILKLCTFDNLSNLEVNMNGKLASGEANSAFFRRGEVGDWKNYLTGEMVERFDKISKQKFSDSGLVL